MFVFTISIDPIPNLIGYRNSYSYGHGPRGLLSAPQYMMVAQRPTLSEKMIKRAFPRTHQNKIKIFATKSDALLAATVRSHLEDTIDRVKGCYAVLKVEVAALYVKSAEIMPIEVLNIISATVIFEKLHTPRFGSIYINLHWIDKAMQKYEDIYAKNTNNAIQASKQCINQIFSHSIFFPRNPEEKSQKQFVESITNMIVETPVLSAETLLLKLLEFLQEAPVKKSNEFYRVLHIMLNHLETPTIHKNIIQHTLVDKIYPINLVDIIAGYLGFQSERVAPNIKFTP